jgi:hypothetical protein
MEEWVGGRVGAKVDVRAEGLVENLGPKVPWSRGNEERGRWGGVCVCMWGDGSDEI